jgi:NCS2 family nucleobase:cation symporter-2
VGIILHSGISSAAIMAVLLNLLFNHLGGKSAERSAFIPGTGRIIREEDLARLLANETLFNGDTIKDGKILDAEGEEVPVVTASQEVVITDGIKTGRIRSRHDIRRALAEADAE